MTNVTSTLLMSAEEARRLEKERLRISQLERECWTRVKGKHPGQAGHDRKAWAEWQVLANRMQELASKLAVAVPKGYLRR